MSSSQTSWRRSIASRLTGVWRRGPGRRIGRGDAAPMEPAAFTAFVAERFRNAAPGVRCEVADTLVLDIGEPADAPTGRLNALYAACQVQPADREALVDGLVAQMAPATRGYAPVLGRSMLRLVVRARADLEAFREAGGGEPAARPLVGDLWTAVAFRAPARRSAPTVWPSWPCRPPRRWTSPWPTPDR
jgi:hypothetical protein